MRAILPKLISPLQIAFLLNSDIHDNILITHQILSMFNRKYIENCIWLLYWIWERLTIGLIEIFIQNFVDLDFSNKWIIWIMQCITILSSRVIVNGGTGCSFQLESIIRQGDPISPYIVCYMWRVFGCYIHFMSIEKKSGIGI